MNYIIDDRGKDVNFESISVFGEDGNWVNGSVVKINDIVTRLLNEKIQDIDVKYVYSICVYLDVLGKKITLGEVCKVVRIEWEEKEDIGFSSFDKIDYTDVNKIEKNLLTLIRNGLVKIASDKVDGKIKQKEIILANVMMKRGNKIPKGAELEVIRLANLKETTCKEENLNENSNN